MANFKRYRTLSFKTYLNSRLMADPEIVTLPSGVKLLKARFFDGSSDERDTDMPVTACVNIGKRPFLAKLRKGDQVQTGGKETYRIFVKKDGTPGMAAEIRYPDFFESLADLRERPEPGAEEQPEPPAEDDEDGFFGDE